MDETRFDGLARALGGAESRRGALRLALGGLLGSLGLAAATDAALADAKGGTGKNRGKGRKAGAKASGGKGARDRAAAARGARGKGKGKRRGTQETLAAGQFQALFCDDVAACNAAQPDLCFPPGANRGDPSQSKCSCQGNRCKVAICHATGSVANPYTNPTVSFNAAGQLQGHEGHGDDLIPEPAAGCPAGCPSGVTCAGACCARGERCSAGRCCPSGQEWNGTACIEVQCTRDSDCPAVPGAPCMEPSCDAGVCGGRPAAGSVACGSGCTAGTCANGACLATVEDGDACGAGAGLCCGGVCEEGAQCCPGQPGICPAAQTCNGSNRCECPTNCRAGQVQASDCSCGCPEACPDGQIQAEDCSCNCPGTCPDGQVQADDCSCDCPTGQTLCGTACVDTGSDSANCGACGAACPAGSTCVAGSCTSACTPDCTGRICGDDGCGGSCGACPTGAACTAAGTCTTIPTPPCVPFCSAGSCGSDGCGGSCDCPSGQVCDTTSFTCAATCTPDCAGRACGTDGCGGSCGTCPDGLICDETAGVCQETPAICAPTGGDCTNVACCEAADTCLALDGVLTCQPTPPAPDRCAHAGERPTEGQRCCDRLHREGGICVINRWDHCDPRKRGKASFCENGTRCVGGRLSPHRTTVCVPRNKRRGRGGESAAMTTPAP